MQILSTICRQTRSGFGINLLLEGGNPELRVHWSAGLDPVQAEILLPCSPDLLPASPFEIILVLTTLQQHNLVPQESTLFEAFL